MTAEAAERTASPFGSVPIEVCGHDLVADLSGALYWPAERTLVVADLHLGKASHFAARGIMLPPYEARETLARLAACIARFAPRRVVALGDSLHDETAASRLCPSDLGEVARLQAGRDWLWLTGNHDPSIAPCLGGETAEAVAIGGIRLRHMPDPEAAAGELAGHLHPAARVRLGGAGVRRPCFVGNRDRLILPAFGALTGGLNVLDPAFAPLFAASQPDILVLGGEGIYPVAPARLAPD